MRKLLKFSSCITMAGTLTTSSDKKRRPAPRRLVSVAGLRAPSQANGAAVPLGSGMPQVLDPCLRVVNRVFVIGYQLASATTSGRNAHIRWQLSDVWSSLYAEIPDHQWKARHVKLWQPVLRRCVWAYDLTDLKCSENARSAQCPGLFTSIVTRASSCHVHILIL